MPRKPDSPPASLPIPVPGTDLEIVAIHGAGNLPGASPRMKRLANAPATPAAARDRTRYLVAMVLHPNSVYYYDVATHTYRSNAPRQATLFRRPSVAKAVQDVLGDDEHSVLKCAVDAQGRLLPETIEFKGWRRFTDAAGVELWEPAARRGGPKEQAGKPRRPA